MTKRYKRQQINITQKDADIIPHLKKQPNISQYVIRLIREDMNKNKETIEQVVLEVLNKHFKQNPTPPQKNKHIEQSIKNVLNL